jgi:hypothetical protein
VLTCGLGSPDREYGGTTKLLATLGTIALGLAVLSVVTGSLTALSLLLVDIVVVWAASTLRSALHGPHEPVAA